jgi:hypothetical protein
MRPQTSMSLWLEGPINHYLLCRVQADPTFGAPNSFFILLVDF